VTINVLLWRGSKKGVCRASTLPVSIHTAQDIIIIVTKLNSKIIVQSFIWKRFKRKLRKIKCLPKQRLPNSWLQIETFYYLLRKQNELKDWKCAENELKIMSKKFDEKYLSYTVCTVGIVGGSCGWHLSWCHVGS